MGPRIAVGAGSASPTVPLMVSPRSLAAAFTRIADPRRAGSVTYPLAAILSLAVTAILANHLSGLAIAQWGGRQPADRLRLLGFLGGGTPCQSTLQRLFCKLDGQALAEALSAHFAPVLVPLPVAAGSQGGGRRRESAAGPAAVPAGRVSGAYAERLLPRAPGGAGPGAD